MAKMSKFQRSQKAHSRLYDKHMHISGKVNYLKRRYHESVWNAQKAKQRVLSLSERKKIYKTISDRVH